MTRYLDLEVFVTQCERQGFVVRDVGLVHSALARPETHLFADPAYPSIDLKAAALMESLAKNHAFIDGNKRAAWLGLNYFLVINGWELVANDDDAFDYILGVATSALSLGESAAWIAAHRRALPA